jgi:hypothetical protein
VVFRKLLLTELQSGFRRGRSTTDQLVRLESFVAKLSFAVSMLRLYFLAWKKRMIQPGNMVYSQDLKNAGLRGRLPTFVSNFLSNRKFNVRVGPYLSHTYRQEIGVPQGSVLSVTKFVIKINNIVNCLPAGVRGSLFVSRYNMGE